jgi:hypothetical protein
MNRGVEEDRVRRNTSRFSTESVHLRMMTHSIGVHVVAELLTRTSR